MRRPLPNLPRKPILSSCHKIAQPEELDNWAVWLRTCFKKHFHCSSRREEAQKFGSFIGDQSLLTSAATILKHALNFLRHNGLWFSLAFWLAAALLARGVVISEVFDTVPTQGTWRVFGDSSL